jgi:ubiquinone/menaquinone biosynthesis C-methylase UbiE
MWWITCLNERRKKMSQTEKTKSHETVQEYYGKVLKTKADLQTSACCTADAMPDYLKPIAAKLHPEVQEKFYGCGSPIPEALAGKTVLDLGCGSGRDCYVLSSLVGENGKVIGVDMTEEQLAVAKRHSDYHAKEFGYQKSNITFHKGYIEDLASIGVESNSIDVVVSNCVINLSPNKEKVFEEIFRVLKPGGELYFSDVFSSRRIPKHLAEDPILLGECLGGALYTEDFRRMLLRVGCADYRIVANAPLDITNAEVNAKAGMIDFYSTTVRAFKLELEDRCEDFGQVACYLGGIEESPHTFKLDDHHLFKVGMPMLVCGNTVAMLSSSRFNKYFRIDGNMENHLGLFGGREPLAPVTKQPSGTGCC